MASSSHRNRDDGGHGRAHAVVAVTMQEIRSHRPLHADAHWHLSYQALVDIAERNTEFGKPLLCIVDIFEEDPRQIHEEFPIDTTIPTIPWSWKGMLQQMSDVMLEKVVGDGIKGICSRCICVRGTTFSII